MPAESGTFSAAASSGYLPALDGMRACAIAFVVLSHTGLGLEKWFPGTLGVVLFFVMSGFLITRQVLPGIESPGPFHLGRFYTRRTLRLLPVLIAYLALFVPLLSALGAQVTWSQLASGFIGANYYHIFIGYPVYSPLPILWSLSIEEHYYIVFPLLLLALRNMRRQQLPFLLAMIIASLLWRMMLYYSCQQGLPLCGNNVALRMQGTDTMLDCVLCGAAGWMVMQYYPRLQTWLIHPQAAAGALFTLLLCFIIRDPFFRNTIRYSLEAAACTVLMLNLLYGTQGQIAALLGSKPARFAGKISYPLYLVHFGVLITIEAVSQKQHLNNVYDIAIYLSASLLLATCFYITVEKPMMKIRRMVSQQEIAS